MKPKDLYHQIAEIYNNFEFSTKLIIDEFMIIFKDNYYLCYHKLDDDSKIQLRLEVDKDYTEYTMIYDFNTDKGHYPVIQIENDQDIPEPIMNKIKPIIRHFKLNQLI